MSGIRLRLKFDSTSDLCNLHSRILLSLVSLLFVVVLFSSCFVSMFDNVSPFVSGAPDIVVSNEAELRDAINNAVKPTIIALNRDITLADPLTIPANKDITLTSTSTAKLFKLIGPDSYREYNMIIYFGYPDTITVKEDGVLRLDGIIVTHTGTTCGAGVTVNVGGTLIMHSGEISGYVDPNYFSSGFGVDGCGGGVFNGGVFEMFGGIITNRTRYGVGNSEYATFSMSGGEITNIAGSGVNNVRRRAGMEWAMGVFSMSGGVIRNNVCGVQNSGNFSMSGGVISGNTAIYGDNWVYCSGGGVSNSGIFSMSGGEISGNTVSARGGGVYNYPDGNFSLSKTGVISNNKAEVGGGVYNAGTFNRRNGVISDNTATQYDNIYSHNGVGELPNENGGSSNNNDGLFDDSDKPFNILFAVIISVLVLSVVGVLFYFRKKYATEQNQQDKLC